MLIETVGNYASMSSVGASIIYADAMNSISQGRRYNLGLATGNTMITLYEELAAKFNAARADLSLLSTWNLDEYSTDGTASVPHDHPLSYWKYMHEKLFSKFDPALGFDPANAHFPDPVDSASYDPAIAAAGGLDLQLLGIGFNGHIAFNEPGSALTSRTRMVSLTPQTIKDNARFFKKASDVPQYALSMGVGSIMEAKKVILLAFGKNKAAAVAAAVEGGVSQFCTASALQMHQDAWFFCDEEAASKLKLKKYYAWRAEGELARA